MWAFFDFGLLMPALVPAAVKDREDVLAWTNNGEYDLQVRGRLREHLQYFMDTYMEDGTYNPEIHATPDKDYNFRFYTTVEAYAEGIKQAALKMDYEKFKVTSERFSWNKKYHSILNSIWATVCGLNEPGGFYGPRSAENPDGYLPRSEWGEYDDGWYTRRHNSVNRRIGSSFGIPDFEDYEQPEVWFGDETIDYAEILEDESIEYVPEEERKMYEIIDSLDEYGIPMRQWWSYTSPREFALITPVLKESYGKKVFKAMKRKNSKKAMEMITEYNRNN